MTFVLDSSVTMSWCFPDVATDFTDAVLRRLRQTDAIVPAVWPLEVANVLLVAQRRARATEAQVGRFVQLLNDLPISVDHGALAAALGPILALGRETGLSSYDAACLELAARAGPPLATQNARLRAAAEQIGVPLVS